MQSRKFRVADAMVLVAATAVGMAILTVHLGSVDAWRTKPSPSHPSPVLAEWLTLRAQIAGAGIFLALWTVVVFGLQGREALRPNRRLARSPGFAVCLATGLGLVFWAAVDGGDLIKEVRFGDLGSNAWIYVARMPGLVGPCVGSARLILAIGGRGRRRPAQDWRDRAARWLGWSWLALFAAVEIPWHRSG